MTTKRIRLIVGAVLSACAFSTYGATVNWGITQEGGTSPFTFTDTISNVGVSSITGSEAGDDWTANWDWDVDPDPFINNNFTLTNTSGSTQTFTVFAGVTVSTPIFGSSLTGGSVAGTITDSGNTALGVLGATISSVGATSIYTSLIDGVAFETLLDNPFSVTTPFGSLGFGGPADSFGLPGNTFPGPAVLSSIGISIHFSLSADDSVSFTSRFEVQPVPVPAAAWLFVSGFIGLMSVARAQSRRVSI